MNKKYLVGLCVVLIILVTAIKFSGYDFSQFVQSEHKVTRAQSVVSVLEKFDIDEQEKLGGHTIEKHVGKSDAWLKERSQTPFFVNKHIIASSFANKEVAATFTKEVITSNGDAIDAWLADGKKIGMKSFEYDFAKIVGFGVDQDGKMVEFTKVRVLLKKTNDGGFYVLTAYPS